MWDPCPTGGSVGTCGCRAVPSSMCVHMPVTCMYVHSEGGRPRHLLPFPLRAQGGAGPGPKSHGAPSRPSGQDCASQPSLSPSVRFHRASRLRGEPSLARGPADTQSRGLAGSWGRVALEQPEPPPRPPHRSGVLEGSHESVSGCRGSGFQLLFRNRSRSFTEHGDLQKHQILLSKSNCRRPRNSHGAQPFGS